MANVRFAQEVRAQIDEAIADGAVAHIAKSPADDGGAYLTPQILTNVNHDMRVMRDESFGPVVGIMPVKDRRRGHCADERLSVRPDRIVWTQDAAKAEEIGDRIETGTVFMNRCDYLDPALCWTGCKDTGRGAGLSIRHPGPHPTQIISPQKGTRMTLTANWSYPTAIRFGQGRIAEIGDACAKAGISKPLLVTDRGLAQMAITAENPRPAGRGRAGPRHVQPKSTQTPTRTTWKQA
jgi:hypothetical protein